MSEKSYACHVFVTLIHTRLHLHRVRFIVSDFSRTFVRMFERLQTKWKVNSTQLFLVLCVFALGGSATGWLGKLVMNWLSISSGWLWTLLYVIVVTLIWPIAVLIVSIPFGQFSFFTKYLTKIGRRMRIVKAVAEPGNGVLDSRIENPESSVQNPASGIQNLNIVSQLTPDSSQLTPSSPVNIAIFASGAGSNAKKIIEYFHHPPKSLSATVKLVVCNKPGAGVLDIARQNGVATILIEKEKFFRGDGYIAELKNAEIQFIVLAGFLWKIPQTLIDHYRNRIINIHPALLPKFGGKGMYGLKVHEAVIMSGETESGITIHYVDEHYDNGDIVFQEKVSVARDETPESLAGKIHELEHTHYPRIIEHLILSQMVVKNPT